MNKWYETHLYEVADFLEESGYFSTPKDVVDFIEKPQRYDREASIILDPKLDKEEKFESIDNL